MPDDIIYLAGRPLTIGDHEAQPGEEIDVSEIPLLESFISAGYIYRVTPDQGYDRLPPHMFSAVQTRQEAEQAIFATDKVVNTQDVAAQEAFEESDVYKRAEAQAIVSQGRNSPTAQAKANILLAQEDAQKTPARGTTKKEK